MLKRYQSFVGGTFRVVDAVVIALAWVASYYLRFYVPFIAVTKGFPSFNEYAAMLPVVVSLWLIVFSQFKIYQPKSMLRRTHEVQAILQAHGVSMLFFFALTYLFSEYRYSRVVMVLFGLLGIVSLVSIRLIFRNLIRSYYLKGYSGQRTLMVGEGKTLSMLLSRLSRFPELGLRVVGVVVSKLTDETTISGHRILGLYPEIKTLLKSQNISRVCIALPRVQTSELDEVLALLKSEAVEIQLIPDLHEYIALGCAVEDFDGLPLLNLNDSPLSGWVMVFKRVMDTVLSFFGLLFLSPLLFCLSILIKLTSSGPIFYRQERMGLDGKTFHMLKFRSMRIDAEGDSGAVWTVENDPRRTAFGSFLRRTSLDELPQLWNVFCGDMSLVGPRPERPVFVEQFKKDIPYYMLRHKVKSGMTGWAQVNGWRGNTSLEKRIECDLYYIRHWSFSLDAKILILTVWRGFIHKNAY